MFVYTITVPGVIGSMQALEALKIASGAGCILSLENVITLYVQQKALQYQVNVPDWLFISCAKWEDVCV